MFLPESHILALGFVSHKQKEGGGGAVKEGDSP